MRDALGSAELLVTNTRDRSFEDYRDDVWLQGAVERRLEIVGEALRRVRDAGPSIELRLPDIHRWISLRNVVAHLYEQLDLEVIWSNATIGAAQLIDDLRSLLDEPVDR